jgi:integrase
MAFIATSFQLRLDFSPPSPERLWHRKQFCRAIAYADALRAFFRYAEQCGWCKPGIAEGITSPTLYAQEGLPEGPEWKDVQRLLKGIKGESSAALRAGAVLFLLAVYGLRSGEISRLLLSDFGEALGTC